MFQHDENLNISIRLPDRKQLAYRLFKNSLVTLFHGVSVLLFSCHVLSYDLNIDLMFVSFLFLNCYQILIWWPGF